MQDGFYKSRVADAAFTGCQFVAYGTQTMHATPASDPTKPIMGVSDTLAVAPGQFVDVQMTQIADLVAGGTIAYGDRLTTDANGHAVKAVKQAGATVYTAGYAQSDAVLGDIFPILIAPGAIDG